MTNEFNRADQLDGKRKSSVGFALTILQRRLASSPEAIYQSLRRRRERLESRLTELKDLARGTGSFASVAVPFDEDFDEDDLTPEELEGLEESVIDQASASATAAELEVEIATLRDLERRANKVRMSGEDRKWDELSHLLQENASMFSEDGRREKLIIFTEHKDTLEYLATKIRQLLEAMRRSSPSRAACRATSAIVPRRASSRTARLVCSLRRTRLGRESTSSAPISWSTTICRGTPTA